MEIFFHFLFLIFAKRIEKGLSDLLKVTDPLQYSYIHNDIFAKGMNVTWRLLWTVPGTVRDEELFSLIGSLQYSWRGKTDLLFNIVPELIFQCDLWLSDVVNGS